MDTLLLTDPSNPSRIIAERTNLRTRLSTRVRARALDRALAAGVSPDSSAALSERARKLIGPATRVDLARSIRNVLGDARRPRDPLTPQVPLCRGKIVQSARTLERLAERLVSDEPVDARGVAQVRLLLVGDRGALFD